MFKLRDFIYIGLIIVLIVVLAFALATPSNDIAEVVGPQRETGETGAQGEKGDTGAIGPQGLTGETGPQGEKGETGATGPQGEKGDTGEKGEKGDTGAVGPQGEKGADGHTPYIGANGNWWINGQDTGYASIVEVEKETLGEMRTKFKFKTSNTQTGYLIIAVECYDQIKLNEYYEAIGSNSEYFLTTTYDADYAEKARATIIEFFGDTTFKLTQYSSSTGICEFVYSN